MDILWAFIAAAVFAAIFLFGGKLARIRGPWRRRGLSAAAGATCAYVFIHLLPELAHAREVFVEATSHRSLPFPEYRVYVSALAGFIILYGLESLVSWNRHSRRGESATRRILDPVFLLHIGGFAAYGWLTSYLMVRGIGEEQIPVLPYILAMGLHFFCVDHALAEEHGARYERPGRQILAVAILAGWACAALTELSKPLVVTLLGLIAGGVIVNSMVMELPREKEGRFLPFVIGSVGYTVLLLFIG